MYINDLDAPLSIAAWLASDFYDHHGDPNALSATSFLQPLRALILSKRLYSQPLNEYDLNISNYIASSYGVALHDSIEKVWTQEHYKGAMLALDYPEKVINKIEVNPTTEKPNTIPVYVERRREKVLNNIIISGKLDFTMQGVLEDFKSTSVWNWIYQSNVEDYIMQGSIYAWLHDDIITEDYIKINYIFTDWSKAESLRKADYPKKRIVSKKYPLLSMDAVKGFLELKIKEYMQYKDALETDLPQCTDKELWKKETLYKYYANPEKKKRSNKNFTNKDEAYTYFKDKKFVGEIIEVPGEVVRCKYCNAYNLCSQKDTYLADGSLVI
jgi:hypothetical protein